MIDEYIYDMLIIERRQCSFLIIECQGKLNSESTSEEDREIYQTIIDQTYARSKELNKLISKLDG